MPGKKTTDKNGAGGRTGRVKFRYADSERYMDLDMDSPNEAVADGLKSLANAFAGRTILGPARTLIAPKPATPPPSAAVSDQQEIEFPSDADQSEQDNTDAEEIVAEETPHDSGSVPKRAYNYRPPKFLDDLDLTKATKPLADFITEKGSPTETNDRYIAVAVWLKEHMQVEEFTINHIYTAFDSLGWKSQIPVNHSQPLRDLKTKRHFLTKEKGAGGYKVNWQGIQYVAKMGGPARMGASA
jgi:hypothetical protein